MFLFISIFTKSQKSSVKRVLIDALFFIFNVYQVTDENKDEYMRLVCQMKMTGAIRKQLSAFLEGFYDIIPRRLISIFNEQELELLLSGR